jgi:hypothetical protein
VATPNLCSHVHTHTRVPPPPPPPHTHTQLISRNGKEIERSHTLAKWGSGSRKKKRPILGVFFRRCRQLRWFDRLDHGSIHSWQEMSESFTARLITNTRKPKEIDALLALKMKAEKTLKSYSARYWEVYNDINACDEDIVVKTFRFGLHQDIKLRRVSY